MFHIRMLFNTFEHVEMSWRVSTKSKCNNTRIVMPQADSTKFTRLVVPTSRQRNIHQYRPSPDILPSPGTFAPLLS